MFSQFSSIFKRNFQIVKKDRKRQIAMHMMQSDGDS